MNVKNRYLLKPITPNHPSLPVVITPSIGAPGEIKIKQVLQDYAKPDRHLTGCFLESRLIGVIGFEIPDTKLVIKHIAVAKKHRSQGIGTILIEHILKHYPVQYIAAETDAESVDFYKKCGFECSPLTTKYGKRYCCARLPN